jgi:hypothetical protein
LVSTPNYHTAISIADLLNYVNQYFPDILSEPVLRLFGYTARPEGKIGESVYSERVEIKKHSHKGGRLYLTVAMTKIKADVLGKAVNDKNHLALSLMSTLGYSLANIFKNVNPLDTHFLEYIPDGFLTEAQKEAKQAAIKEDTDRISKFSKRETDRISNRSLLANALESATQNDIERYKLKLYKEKIKLIESEEQKLQELKQEIQEIRFKKGGTQLILNK